MRAKQVKSLLDDVQASLGAKINTLGAYVMQMAKKEKINPLDLKNIGDDYLSVLRSLDVQQHGARYVWKGLPDYLSEWLLEHMLYYKGSLGGVIVAGTLYVLPWVSASGVGAYGQPNSFDLISYNGTQGTENVLAGLRGFETIMTNEGTLNPRASGAILYDRMPEWSSTCGNIPRATLIARLISDEAEMLGRVRVNVQNATTKLVFYVEDESQADVLRRDLCEQYGSADPFVIVVRDAANENDAQPLQNNIDIETQALFECFQSLNSIRCMTLGIPNNGAFEKKERKITGELDADSQTAIVLRKGLEMRRLWIAQMKYIYGTTYPDIVGKLSVDIAEELVPTEEDMQEEKISAADSHPQGGEDNA